MAWGSGAARVTTHGVANEARHPRPGSPPETTERTLPIDADRPTSTLSIKVWLGTCWR